MEKPTFMYYVRRPLVLPSAEQTGQKSAMIYVRARDVTSETILFSEYLLKGYSQRCFKL
jgi:hypothetical protein